MSGPGSSATVEGGVARTEVGIALLQQPHRRTAKLRPNASPVSRKVMSCDVRTLRQDARDRGRVSLCVPYHRYAHISSQRKCTIIMTYMQNTNVSSWWLLYMHVHSMRCFTCMLFVHKYLHISVLVRYLFLLSRITLLKLQLVIKFKRTFITGRYINIHRKVILWTFLVLESVSLIKYITQYSLTCYHM